jgi:hypothetical protein
LTVSATVKKLSVVGPASATSSVTIKSFEWKPVWVATAARFFSGNTFDSSFDWATGISGWVEVGVVVSVGVVGDWGSGDQESEQVINKDTFDGAGSGGAVIGWVVGLATGESVWTLAGTWSVVDFPWNARAALGLTIDDGALVSVGKSFAESIDLVDRGTFTSSNVVVEVAPASVLVQSFDSGLDVSRECSERAVLDLAHKLLVDAGFVGSDDGDNGGDGEFHGRK